MNYWMLGNGILVGSCLISLVISAVVLLGMTALKFLNFASLSFKKKGGQVAGDNLLEQKSTFLWPRNVVLLRFTAPPESLAFARP